MNLQEAIVIITEIVWWATASVRIQANQISRAVIIDAANNSLEAELVWVSFKSRWTIAAWNVILGSTHGILSTMVFEVIGNKAWVITFTGIKIAFL